MRPGKAHIVIALFLLFIAGCRLQPDPEAAVPDSPGNHDKQSKNQKPHHTKRDTIPGIYRFAENPAVLGSGEVNQEPPVISPYDYYIPVEEIEGAASLTGGVSSTRPGSTIASPRLEPGFQTEPEFFIHGRTSDDIYAVLTVDNDLFDYTDYYYTAGQSLEVLHPAISASPFSYLLPGLRRSVNYFGLSLTINLYTPRYLNRAEIIVGDRPFAAYMTLGHHRYSLDPYKHSRLESHLEMGVIGPNSLGQTAQDIFHSDKPVGWVNQVGNDIVANYGVRYEKSLIYRPCFDLALVVGSQVGTLYDNLTGGLFLQAGKSNGRYQSLFQTHSGNSTEKNHIRYYFNLSLENKLVFYDATLQGGLFNRNSIYTIDDDHVRRYLFTGRLGAGIGYGRFSLEAEQVFLTPEFDGGYHHLWFRARLIAFLN